MSQNETKKRNDRDRKNEKFPSLPETEEANPVEQDETGDSLPSGGNVVDVYNTTNDVSMSESFGNHANEGDLLLEKSAKTCAKNIRKNTKNVHDFDMEIQVDQQQCSSSFGHRRDDMMSSSTFDISTDVLEPQEVQETGLFVAADAKGKIGNFDENFFWNFFSDEAGDIPEHAMHVDGTPDVYECDEDDCEICLTYLRWSADDNDTDEAGGELDHAKRADGTHDVHDCDEGECLVCLGYWRGD